jgi:predicted Zn-dependent protease with MMP-like domain
VIDVAEERFEELVGEALASIPEELARHVENVAVFVEDRHRDPRILGLYEGIPLTRRDAGYFGVMPDRITIYRRTILSHCATEEDVVDQVRRTVIHEVAHHFGIGDGRLHELGWG